MKYTTRKPKTYKKAEYKEPKVSNLKEGMELKNYKELCDVLEVDVKNGRSKEFQIKDFERYFAFNKYNNSYKITEIFDEPLEKIDERINGNRSIYVKCIETLLCKYLSETDGYSIELSKIDLWRILGMVNNNYRRESKEQIKENSLLTNITDHDIRDFYCRSNDKLNTILTSALRNLKNRALIESKIVKYVYDVNNNQIEIKTDTQIKMILAAEKYALEQLGYTTMYQVMIHDKIHSYYNYVNEYLKNQYGWKYYTVRIHIVYLQDAIAKELPQMEEDVRKAKAELNNNIVTYLNDNAEIKYKKYLEDDNKKGYLQKFYVDAQKFLAEELINIDHKNIPMTDEEVEQLLLELDYIDLR